MDLLSNLPDDLKRELGQKQHKQKLDAVHKELLYIMREVSQLLDECQYEEFSHYCVVGTSPNKVFWNLHDIKEAVKTEYLFRENALDEYICHSIKRGKELAANLTDIQIADDEFMDLLGRMQQSSSGIYDLLEHNEKARAKINREVYIEKFETITKDLEDLEHCIRSNC
jgi:hypothetical protein